MFDKKGFMDKIGNAAKKAADLNQKVTQEFTDKKLNQMPEDTQGHTMYEAFMPSFGMGKKFVFTESTLILADKEYPYTSLTTINLVNPPTAFTDGVAQTTCDGTVLTLGYNVGQSDRFIKAMNYANEQIDKANGVTRAYKYLLNCGADTKIEVYDDYIMFYRLKGGVTAVIGNSIAGGTSGSVILFSDLAIELGQGADGNTVILLTVGQDTLSLPVSTEDVEKAQTIIAYIDSTKKAQESAAPEFENEAWEPITTSVREFPLGDKILRVSEEMDVFNSYRNVFRDLADRYSTAARAEYNKRVNSLSTYLDFFPKIYVKYLDALGMKAMDIFIAEGIYTTTKDSFLEQHVNEHHSAIDQLNITLESVELTVQKNVSKVATVTSFIPNLVGGGFGLKGALTGIAKAEAFNFVRDGVEAGLMNSVAQISMPQQEELFGRINPDNLFLFVYNDYWQVFLTIVNEFIANGKNVWLPSDEQAMRAKNIFSNMSNPNFPQDKKLEVFISILTTFPYSREYLQYMVNTYGDNEQTAAIRNYFGYSNFDDPKLGL